MSFAMHPAAVNLLLQVMIACLQCQECVSEDWTAKSSWIEPFFPSSDPKSWLQIQCIHRGMHVLSSSCARHQGLPWIIWKTLEWRTSMCLIRVWSLWLLFHSMATIIEQFHQKPQKAAIRNNWTKYVFLRRQVKNIKDQSKWKSKINEKNWVWASILMKTDLIRVGLHFQRLGSLFFWNLEI